MSLSFVWLMFFPMTVAPDGLWVSAMHRISSQTLMEYVIELCSGKYGGRLTGTREYDAAARWLGERLRDFGVRPAGDDGTYFQSFPHPYTRVLAGSRLILHIPQNKDEIRKEYRFEADFFPGATSDSGKRSLETVYVGYGISAPELDYDEYRGVDVRGKYVVVEVEVPVSPERDP